MRGKKVDTEFLSNFIKKCADENKCSPDQILQEAKDQIYKIDNKIREVESLKINRSKLIDVINAFDKQEKVTPDIAKSLPLFNIKNGHICKFICDLLKCNNIKFESIYTDNFNTHDILFCVKQLIENKIISKVGDYLLQGSRYDEYVKIVLQEK